MKKKLLSVILSVILCLAILPIGITASAEIHIPDVRDLAPRLTNGWYDPETTMFSMTFTTQDTESRFFEGYMLTTADIESVMGTITINGILYQLLGIMSYDRDDPSHVKVEKNGDTATVTLTQECYFASNEPPQPGDAIYFTAQTEGSHGEDDWGSGSEFAAPWQYMVPSLNLTPTTPTGMRAYVESMQYGEMYVEHYGNLTGNVATVNVTFDRKNGQNHFFASPLRSDLSKVMCGTAPFFHIYKGYPGWENWGAPNAPMADIDDEEMDLVYDGPNGETITMTPDTLTVQIKVLTCEEFPEGWPYGYTTGENIIIGLASMNSDGTEMSELETVEIPFDETSVGKTFEPFVPDPIKNTSTISSDEIVKGSSITVNASATGGMGDYQYKVLYKKSTSTNYTTLSDYSDKSEVVFKPKSTGEYNIVVKAKDKAGKVVKAEFTVKVNGVLKNTSAISAQAITKGDTVTVYASATGGVGDYEYTVLYKKAASTKYTTASKYSDKSEITIKPGSTGDYNIVVKVRDKTGKVARQEFDVMVTAASHN